MKDRVLFANVGTGKSIDDLYAPLLDISKEDVEFVGVWSRAPGKARELGEKYHVPWFIDLEQMRNAVTFIP